MPSLEAVVWGWQEAAEAHQREALWGEEEDSVESSWSDQLTSPCLIRCHQTNCILLSKWFAPVSEFLLYLFTLCCDTERSFHQPCLEVSVLICASLDLTDKQIRVQGCDQNLAFDFYSQESLWIMGHGPKRSLEAEVYSLACKEKVFNCQVCLCSFFHLVFKLILKMFFPFSGETN